MKSLLIGFAVVGMLLARCSAEMRTIRVEGYFDAARNFGWWSSSELWQLPVPYVMTVEFDDEAEDEDPNPNRGVYETEDGRVTLYFNGYTPNSDDYYFSVPVTEVRIWNGYGGLKGVSFGNEEEFEAFGIFFGAYTGIYYTALVPVGWPGVTMNGDALSNIFSLEGNTALSFNSYSYVYGFDHDIEIELQDHTVSYTIE